MAGSALNMKTDYHLRAAVGSSPVPRGGGTSSGERSGTGTNERSVLKPYRQPRHRQAFHDGVRVAQLLVAVRQAQLAGVEDLSRLHHAKTIARITAAISGDTKDFVAVWPKFPPRTVK